MTGAAPSPVGRVLFAIGLAVMGTALAVLFVFPQMQRSDALLRDGLRIAATIVTVEDATCSLESYRRREVYPCFKATAAWTHDGLAYRGTIGYFQRRDEVSVGTTWRIVFAPDPAAAAGNADVNFREFRRDGSEPFSERPVYLGLLALAGLMCLPLVSVVLQGLSRRRG